MKDAKDMVERFCASYEGLFGTFRPDDENEDDFAMAVFPIKSRFVKGNMISISVEDDMESAMRERIEYIDEKSRPGPMGDPVDMDCGYGFDREYGRINNFRKMGIKGGYLYFAGAKEDILVCCELHSMRRHIDDADIKGFMDTVLGLFRRVSHDLSELSSASSSDSSKASLRVSSSSSVADQYPLPCAS